MTTSCCEAWPISPSEPPLPSKRSEVRREELLDAAFRVIRRSGPPVAMEAIAAEAGITRPILYRHFDDVGGLYEAVARRFADQLLASVAVASAERGSIEERIHAQVDAYLALLGEEANLYRFLTRQYPAERPDGEQAISGFVQMLGDTAAAVLRDAGVAAVTAEVAGRSLIGMIRTTADWWLDHPEVERSEVAKELAAVAFSGFSRLFPASPESR